MRVLKLKVLSKKIEVPVTYTKDEKALKSELEKISSSINVKEKDAKIIFNGDQISISNEENGKKLNVEKSMKLVEDELKLPKNESEIPPQLKVALISNMASFLVLDRDYQAALKYNNKLLDISGLDFKRDVYLFARLLSLVIHYELKNYDLLEYMVENTYKFFRDKHVMSKADSILLTHFKRLLKAETSSHSELFDELHHQLTKLQAENNVQNLFAMFSFDAWAYAHAAGTSMQEGMKHKLKIN